MILSLVEHGWEATRRWSLSLERPAPAVTHLIKGVVAPEVKRLIRPLPHERLIGVPHRAFWPAVAWLAAWGRMTGRIRAVLVDNERSSRRLRRWWGWLRVPVIRIRPAADGGYEMMAEGGPVPPAAWRGGA